MKKIASLILLSILSMGYSNIAFGSISIVDKSSLSNDCQPLGYYSSTAGYGKVLNGEMIALKKAKNKAEQDGANYAVILELNRGPSDLNGYCLLQGFICPKVEN